MRPEIFWEYRNRRRMYPGCCASTLVAYEMGSVYLVARAVAVGVFDGTGPCDILLCIMSVHPFMRVVADGLSWL